MLLELSVGFIFSFQLN